VRPFDEILQAIMLRSVVFPEPDGPIIAVTSPTLKFPDKSSISLFEVFGLKKAEEESPYFSVVCTS